MKKDRDDLDAGAFEIARRADVRLFIETRLELNQRGHRLAGFGGLDQRAHHRTVVARPVERLLDGDDGRIAGRLAHELDDDVEAFVGMVDDDVLRLDGGEAVAAEIADPLGKARIVWGEEQVRPLVDDQLLGVDEAEDAVVAKDVALGGVELLGEEAVETVRHAVIDAEPDDMAAPTPLQRRLIEPDEILRLLLDLDLAVAQDAEDTPADNLEAGKEVVEEEAEQLLHRQKTHGCPGQSDKSADRGWDEQQRLHVLAIAAADELKREAEAEIGDEREWVRRVDGERRQDRENLRHELLFEPRPVARQQLLRADDGDAGGAELGPQRAPCHLLVAHQLAGPRVDRRELLHGGQAVLARRRDLGQDMALQTGHPYHVEFVEVACRNRQEAQAFQQGVARIVRLAEDAFVEGEPGKLAIDEPRLGAQINRCGGDRPGLRQSCTPVSFPMALFYSALMAKS